MKELIRKLLIALMTLAVIPQLHAVTIFPIATNSGAVNLNGVGASSGSNYLSCMINGEEAAFQLVSTNGSLIGSLTTLGITSNLPCASFAGTNYLMFWYDYLQTNWRSQPISTAGALIGSSLSFGPAESGRVLLTDGTNFLVAWEAQTNNGYFYGQFLTSAGALSGSPFLLASESKNLAGVCGAANYFFIWQDTNGVSTNYNTYGAFVSKSGSVGTPFQISQTASLDHGSPAVGFDGTNFFALWNTDTSRNASNAPIWNLYGRLVTQSGTLASGELLLNTNQPVFPSLAFDGTNYLVAWSHDLETTNSDKQLAFQFYNRSASPVGPEFTPFSSQGTNQPLFGGPLFDGHRYATIATIGSVNVATNGALGTFTAGAIYGALLSPMPTLTASNYTGTQFTGTLTGTPGFTYAIQYATNITATNWTPLVTNTNGTFSFTDPNATNKARFYRAVVQ
jgi:hypothetical protein